MSKLATLFTLALLLSFTFTFASRLSLGVNNVPSLHEDFAANKESKAELNDESCEGVEAVEECLKRKTLAAHVDYIYTQKPPSPAN